MLEREPADGLAPGHLRALLAFLCDEALDAEGLREALAGRLDSAEEARAAMRRATAEEKRRLNVGPSLTLCVIRAVDSSRAAAHVAGVFGGLPRAECNNACKAWWNLVRSGMGVSHQEAFSVAPLWCHATACLFAGPCCAPC